MRNRVKGTFRLSPGFLPGFLEYAVIGDRTSNVTAGTLQYYARVSCDTDASGNPTLMTDVAGDNQAAPGTTALTWNLQ